MIGVEPGVGVVALLVALVAGLVAHEWAHALVLWLAGVDCTVEYLPDRTDGVLVALSSTRWARVQPRPTGREPAWVFRLAALMPLSLALPVLGLGLGGHLSSENLIPSLAAAGWLACAIPSPQDFSVAFYAHRLLAASDDEDDTSGDASGNEGDASGNEGDASDGDGRSWPSARRS